MSSTLTSLFLSFLFYKMKKRKMENQTSKTKPISPAIECPDFAISTLGWAVRAGLDHSERCSLLGARCLYIPTSAGMLTSHVS